MGYDVCMFDCVLVAWIERGIVYFAAGLFDVVCMGLFLWEWLFLLCCCVYDCGLNECMEGIFGGLFVLMFVVFLCGVVVYVEGDIVVVDWVLLVVLG